MLNICIASLMFVLCVAWLGTADQHYALIVIPLFITQAPTCFGARGGAVVEAQRHKPECRGFDFRWCHWIFSLT
jgi:hypothetical protein